MQFIVLIIIFALLPLEAMAIIAPKPSPSEQPYSGFLDLLLKPKTIGAPVSERPSDTNFTHILAHAPILNFDETDTHAITCIETRPYSHISYAQNIGHASRIITNNASRNIETITFHPSFSGLYGPTISLTRQDIENALRDSRGSAAEIFHNTTLNAQAENPCKNRFHLESDLNIRTHIDAFDSDKSPLYRTDGIGTARAFMGRHFMGSLGIRIPFNNNLAKDSDLLTFDSNQVIGQDDIGYAEQPLSLDHLTANAFWTPRQNLYAAMQAGFLEERFIGIGGEILYRPFDAPWSIGFDAWGTMKRASIDGNGLTWAPKNKQFSAFANAYYDIQKYPVTFGLSLGRFLDGDIGSEIKAIYKPKSGWRFEGFTRYSNEADKSLDHNKRTNLTAGLSLVIPLEQLKGIPNNSRATTTVAPFGQDKRQRIDNHYPIYTLTDPWSAANIYRQWNDVTD